jgi:G2/mitotic-specific cyclin 3/4
MKTLHQRNKSMSALNSSMVVKGLNANPVRRTAFADISNKGKPSNVSDDLSFKPKVSLLETKPLRPVQRDPLASIGNQQPQPLQHGDSNAIKAKSLLRPAQRPLTAATQKALPAEPVNSNVVATYSYLPDFNHELAQPRRTIVKRHTTIFRETASTVPSNPLILSELKPLTSAAPLQPLSTLPSAVEPRVTLSTTTVASQLSTLQPVQPLSQNGLPALPHITPSVETLSTAPMLQPIQQNQISEPAPAIERPTVLQNVAEPELFLPALESQIPEPVSIIDFEEPIPKQPTVDAASLKQAVVDIEEYWDEDEEEFFDAEGCITARSIRSAGGDNTTGGVSVVLNPRTNLRVERELAAAKAWVEENVTSEDIEDEAWDTTMVAEYGDEIFAYIRELEVSTQYSL